MQLEQNIKGLCSKFGIEFKDFLDDLEVENVHELTVYDLEAICEEYDIDMYALLFKPIFKPELYKKVIGNQVSNYRCRWRNDRWWNVYFRKWRSNEAL